MTRNHPWRRRIRSILLLIALLLTLFSGCSESPGTPDESQGTVTLGIQFGEAQEFETVGINMAWDSDLTAQSVLVNYGKQERIPVVLAQGGAYIQGISGLMERDLGDSYGWVYTVNGESPLVSAADYRLEPDDHVLWEYVDLSTLFTEEE